jgi:hypothetical protein
VIAPTHERVLEPEIEPVVAIVVPKVAAPTICSVLEPEIEPVVETVEPKSAGFVTVKPPELEKFVIPVMAPAFVMPPFCKLRDVAVTARPEIVDDPLIAPVTFNVEPKVVAPTVCTVPEPERVLV